jgi:hypothetical protein
MLGKKRRRTRELGKNQNYPEEEDDQCNYFRHIRHSALVGSIILREPVRLFPVLTCL